MLLRELIDMFEKEDPNRILPLGFWNPHSYRGYYNELAFELVADVSIGEMVKVMKSAIGSTYTGWHGGDYTMDEHTECWLATQGSIGETIGPVLVRLMLAQREKVQEMTDQANDENEDLHSRISVLEEIVRAGRTSEEGLLRLLGEDKTRISALEEALNDSEEAHQKGCLVRISALEAALEEIALGLVYEGKSAWVASHGQLQEIARAALSKETP